MSEANGSAPLLEVRNLSKHFGAVQALKEFSMVVHSGEVVAIAGDNGAGKTTLIKAISGVYRPSSGEILLNGARTDFASEVAEEFLRRRLPGLRCDKPVHSSCLVLAD